MELLLFKTDIKTKKKVKEIKSVFNNHPGISRWSVDTWDVDKVLRIEAEDDLREEDIIRLIQPYGFHCEELPD